MWFNDGSIELRREDEFDDEDWWAWIMAAPPVDQLPRSMRSPERIRPRAIRRRVDAARAHDGLGPDIRVRLS